MFSPETIRKLEQMAEQLADELLNRIIERLIEEGIRRDENIQHATKELIENDKT